MFNLLNLFQNSHDRGLMLWKFYSKRLFPRCFSQSSSQKIPEETTKFIEKVVKENDVVVFMKGTAKSPMVLNVMNIPLNL